MPASALDNASLLRYIRGITDACYQHDYFLTLALFNNPSQGWELCQRLLHSRAVDGIIVASTRLDDPLVERLLAGKVPFVCIGRHPDPRVSYVDADNVTGARMAVEYLLRKGHTRVATITGPLNMAVGQDRLEGYRQALRGRHMAVDEALIVEGDFTEQGGMMAWGGLP